MRAMRDRCHGGSPPGHRPQRAREAGTRPARVGRPHGEKAAQDAHRLRRLPRLDPREPRRARGINRWRARCPESGHAGFGGRLPGKGPGSSRMNPGPRWAAHPTLGLLRAGHRVRAGLGRLRRVHAGLLGEGPGTPGEGGDPGGPVASPHPYQVALAELLAARVPSVQRVRFTNSGTEAALLAARIVVRATGRRRLLMFDGAYHGSATLFLPGSPDVVRVPWNDLDAVTALLGRSGHDVAAMFAEPFLGAGGVRPAAPGFLAAVTALARDHDVLFVLDEVQGLRNGFGGEQGRLGLTPDLTLLGKIIGGGFPIGAVGGRADLLELTVATMTPGYVTHAGTFNGHLAAAVAGRGTGST